MLLQVEDNIARTTRGITEMRDTILRGMNERVLHATAKFALGLESEALKNSLILLNKARQ